MSFAPAEDGAVVVTEGLRTRVVQQRTNCMPVLFTDKLGACLGNEENRNGLVVRVTGDGKKREKQGLGCSY